MCDGGRTPRAKAGGRVNPPTRIRRLGNVRISDCGNELRGVDLGAKTQGYTERPPRRTGPDANSSATEISNLK